MSPTALSAEVIVVGGGPAGAATAIALRRRGIDVLVIDRASFPRDKVCGDVLLPEAQHTLHSLGLDLKKIRSIAYPCLGARYVPGQGSEIAGDFRDGDGRSRPWWMVRRREFDEWLLAQAARAGASIVEGISVDNVLRDGDSVCGVETRGRNGRPQRIRARVVVGADGASSTIARAVGAAPMQAEHVCLAGRAYVSGVSLPQPYLEVFTTPRALPGCAWIVPIGANEVNVGVGLVQRTARQLQRTPQQLFDELRRESPLFTDRLSAAGPITLRGWTLPAASARRRLSGAGWLLVGDAGAMVDPFTGHGIHTAIAAGQIAGETIAEALTADDGAGALAAYAERCRTVFEVEVDHGMLLQRLHARPRLMRAAAAACARHAGLRATFLGLVGHSAPRHTLLDPRVLAKAALTFSNPGAAR